MLVSKYSSFRIISADVRRLFLCNSSHAHGSTGVDALKPISVGVSHSLHMCTIALIICIAQHALDAKDTEPKA
jgi:hypothetical protein